MTEEELQNFTLFIREVSSEAHNNGVPISQSFLENFEIGSDVDSGAIRDWRSYCQEQNGIDALTLAQWVSVWSTVFNDISWIPITLFREIFEILGGRILNAIQNQELTNPQILDVVSSTHELFHSNDVFLNQILEILRGDNNAAAVENFENLSINIDSNTRDLALDNLWLFILVDRVLLALSNYPDIGGILADHSELLNFIQSGEIELTNYDSSDESLEDSQNNDCSVCNDKELHKKDDDDDDDDSQGVYIFAEQRKKICFNSEIVKKISTDEQAINNYNCLEDQSKVFSSDFCDI